MKIFHTNIYLHTNTLKFVKRAPPLRLYGLKIVSLLWICMHMFGKVKLIKFSIFENKNHHPCPPLPNPSKQNQNQHPNPKKTKNKKPPRILKQPSKTKTQTKNPWRQSLKFLKGKQSKVFLGESIEVPHVPVNWIYLWTFDLQQRNIATIHLAT